MREREEWERKGMDGKGSEVQEKDGMKREGRGRGRTWKERKGRVMEKERDGKRKGEIEWQRKGEWSAGKGGE